MLFLIRGRLYCHLSFDQLATADLEKQAASISDDLKNNGITVSPKKEIIAIIAYLQRIGTDIKSAPVTENAK